MNLMTRLSEALKGDKTLLYDGNEKPKVDYNATGWFIVPELKEGVKKILIILQDPLIPQPGNPFLERWMAYLWSVTYIHERTKVDESLRGYHELLEYILRKDEISKIDDHRADIILDFDKKPDDMFYHQLVHDAGTKDVKEQKKFKEFLVLLIMIIASDDGQVIHDDVKLLGACDTMYYRTMMTESRGEKELDADILHIQHWFYQWSEWIYRWYQSYSMKEIRERVRFLAWYTSIVIASRCDKTDLSTHLLECTHHDIKRRLSKRKLK